MSVFGRSREKICGLCVWMVGVVCVCVVVVCVERERKREEGREREGGARESERELRV